ncbi:DUF397 domain-containing protein [Actinoallomurus vinaceus]
MEGLPPVQWRRSTRSNEEGGQCVEVAVVETLLDR